MSIHASTAAEKLMKKYKETQEIEEIRFIPITIREYICDNKSLAKEATCWFVQINHSYVIAVVRSEETGLFNAFEAIVHN